jgi:hypothetical protein
MIDATHEQMLSELRANHTVELLVVAEAAFNSATVCLKQRKAATLLFVYSFVE